MAERTRAQAAQSAHAALVETDAERAEYVAQRTAACRALRAEGWSLAQIAELLGVSKTRVAQIVR